MLESFKQLFFDRTFRKHTFRQGLLWTLLAVILGLAAHCTQLGGSHAPPSSWVWVCYGSWA